VVEVGPGVTRLQPGDRVAGHALGVEKSHNSPAEGAFQQYVVLMQHMVSAIPESLSFEQASVLPLALSTAASGMFQKDQLGLTLPGAGPPQPGGDGARLGRLDERREQRDPARQERRLPGGGDRVAA
jgi:NADPH:quinone reductase-like Zn-dependent oxidoreductase